MSCLVAVYQSDLCQFPTRSVRNKKAHPEKICYVFRKNYAPKSFLYFGMKPDFTYYLKAVKLPVFY